ncbi:MAG: hypothetical protein U0R70_10315 [Solirubrobacteraceae bacterium]
MTMKVPSRSYRLIRALLPADRPFGSEGGQRRLGLGRDEHDLAAAGEQPLGLLQADLAAPTTRQRRPVSFRQAM